ncbi:hypothetical protein AJ79_02879 [Helicocarpus griseus UAMH5409]|uniref:SWR1-complex protein 3 domain-containing protein n=1 Tax=Helicocarpus griseus UAMH5409 TaxID=1447875 RepID=A0A2B7Y100_9EURO|nr:hypothetical protein AJ79_02879 [Helicocarpus griseus UAMH5409]
MGEKRKNPARGGDSAAKKRVSEAAPPRDTTPARRKASSTPAVPPSLEPEKKPLPSKIKDGSPLPTLPKPQPTTLSLREYQSYAESAVLAAALQRSRVKWLNDCIFEKYWTKPSKKKSQPQPTTPNPPRESMSKLGPCSIVIEPHHFEAMLYTVRNPQTQPPIQYAPQRPIVQYAPPNNFHQYQPHPPPGQPRQGSSYSPSPHTPPVATPPVQHPPPPNRFEPPNQNNRPPSNTAPPPPNPPGQNRPTQAQPSQAQPPQSHAQGQLSSQPSSQPPGQPPQSQRPPNQPPPNYHAPSHPSQNGPMRNPPSQPPPEPTSQPAKQSPDPVIQMLATRAASNPELKALMRIVASSKANQAQLRTFQAHIDELNAILASRKQNENQNNPHIKAEPQAQTIAPGPPAPSTAAPTPPAPAHPHPSHPSQSPRPIGPNVPAPTHPPARSSPSSYPPYPQQSSAQPIRSKNVQQPPPHNYFHPHTPSQPPLPAPKPDPKAVVFEFVTPAPTGNNSTHATSGDRYLFPANTILDYFPGGTTVIASFLVIKKVDPSAPPPDTTGGSTGGKAKSKKSKLAPTVETPTPTDTPNKTTPAPQPVTPNPDTQPSKSDKPASTTANGPEPSKAAESKPAPKPKIKEYYQPVTMRLHANNPRTLEPLARVVRPAAEVRQYMNDIMDRMERADIEYLALRLPHEGAAARIDAEDEAVQSGSGEQQARVVRGKSKGRGDNGAENGVVVKQEGGNGGAGFLNGEGEVEVEEELKEFYDMPSGIVPLR